MSSPSKTWLLIPIVLLTLSACGSLTTWNGTHAGIKYSIHRDQRNNRIERNEDGRVMYDSPELTVVSDRGTLEINGQPAGAVNKGDHVEVTDLGTVLVNGERRGDKTTGQAENRQRLKQRLAHAEEHDGIQQTGYNTSQ